MPGGWRDRAGRSPGSCGSATAARGWQPGPPLGRSCPSKGRGTMPLRVAKDEQRAAEEAYERAALRRRALAEVRDLLVHADDAAHQARQGAEGTRAEGVAVPRRL